MGVILLSLVLATLATMRVAWFLKEDRLTLEWRRWVVRRWGENSRRSYLVHCVWCLSVWAGLVFVPGTVVAFTMAYPWWQQAILAVTGWLSASMVSGWTLSKLED